MRCFDFLLSVATEVAVAEVVGDDQDDAGRMRLTVDHLTIHLPNRLQVLRLDLLPIIVGRGGTSADVVFLVVAHSIENVGAEQIDPGLEHRSIRTLFGRKRR